MPKLAALRPDIRRDLIVNTLAASRMAPPVVRHRLLRRFGVELARTAYVSPSCFFGSSAVAIGEDTFVNVEVFFDGSGQVTIGARCNVAMQVMFCTSHHPLGGPERRAVTPTVGKPVSVGDGCWIGARATILPGVTIGAGCIVAAGAVVSSDCEPNGLYAGVPARRVRTLDGADG